MKYFLFIAVSIFSGFSNYETKIILNENPEEVRSSILKLIPVGTDLNKAKEIMENNNFNCQMLKDSTFTDNVKIYEHIDFLYCDKEAGFFVSRRWQVAIVINKSEVKEIYVSTGLVGP